MPAPIRHSRKPPKKARIAASAQEHVARLAARLETTIAVLHFRRGCWRLAASSDTMSGTANGDTRVVPRVENGEVWTGVTLPSNDQWMVLVPGSSANWAERDDLDDVLETMGEELTALSAQQRDEYIRRACLQAYALGRRLSRSSAPDYAYPTVASAMANGVRAQYAALAVYSRQEEALRIRAVHGYPAELVEHLRIIPGEGVLGRVFATGKPLLVGESEVATAALPNRLRYRTKSCMVVPLRSAGQVVGVAALADPIEGSYFSTDDFRALRLFVPHAVLAIEREWLREDVDAASRRAMLDPVTRLANRRYLEVRLVGEMQRSRRLGQGLALLVLDVDDFKHVNDSFGHLVGDRVLRSIGTLLTQNVRAFDVCTRYGGEEFVILMPGADQSVAVHVADRIRGAIQSCGDEFGFRLTASVGVALLAADDTPEKLLERADQALLLAKAEGKNTVRFAAHRA